MSNIEILEKAASIILSILILVNGYIIKRKTGTWFFPSCMLSLFWFSYTFFPLVILLQIPVNISSQLLITGSIILFSWTHIFFNWSKAYQEKKKRSTFYFLNNVKGLSYIIYISVFLSILSTLIHINYQNISLLDYLAEPIKTAEAFSKKRYSLQIIHTPFNAISLILSNLGVLLGGVIYLNTKSKQSKLKILLCFLPSLVILFTQSAKGLFFLSVFLFLGGLYISYQTKNKFNINLKAFTKKGLLILIFTPLLLVFSFLSRGFSNSMTFIEMYSRMKWLFSSYFLGHLYCFSDWFNSYNNNFTKLSYDTTNNYYGFYTFNFITRYFDPDKDNIRGLYKEYFSFSDTIHSNIYTIFRGLIMDFGIFGTLLFMLILGIITHKMYHVFLTKENSIIALAAIILIFAGFYISFIASLLTWSVIPVSFLLFYLVLMVSKRKFELKKNY